MKRGGLDFVHRIVLVGRHRTSMTLPTAAAVTVGTPDVGCLGPNAIV